MRKTLLLFIITSLTFLGYGQTPITINSTDMPVSIEVERFFWESNTPIAPTFGNNQTWNYGNSTSMIKDLFYTYPEVDSFFINAGIDYYENAIQPLSDQLGYDFTVELDSNGSTLHDGGHYVYRQAYSLAGFTGNTSDSLTFPEQSQLSDPVIILKYPVTNGSNWRSTSRRSTDFNLTVAAFGLNNAPGRHVFNIVRTDTIIGWGKMTVNTDDNPSQVYDVLLEKRITHTTDSFFLNGSPAPKNLLDAFNVSQGQISGDYKYNVYRKGAFAFLARFVFPDSSFKTPSAVLTTITGIGAVGLKKNFKNAVSTLIYPNPSNQGVFNVQLMGKPFEKISYSIYSVTGQLQLERNNVVIQNNNLVIDTHSDLKKGVYVVVIKDDKALVLANQKIQILR